MASRKVLPPLAAAVALAFATPADAQTDGRPYAAARAMIDEAQLGDVFAPVEDDQISVRHMASGLVCRFSRGSARAELTTFSGQPRGDDVGCIRDSADQATTLYATRYAPPISAEQALYEAVAGIRHRFSDARPTPQTVQMSSEGLPEQHVAHFLVTVAGERWITSAIVARSGDWIIKLRYSARAVEDDAVMRHQIEAGAIFTLALLEMNR